jgi:uncharacterized protein (PEP-CTERM system associated)
MLAAGVAAWVACGATARAQGLLPGTAVDTRVGDLRGYFEQAFGRVVPPEAATHGWTFSGGIDVSETYDTGVPIATNGNRYLAHDLITRIAPSVGVSGDSARLVGSLFYSPAVNIYAFHGNQNGIDHNLNGAATATVVPDLFFVDLRAYAAQQSIAGFAGPGGTTALSRSDQVQTTSFSIAPTLRHRFGSIATAELGYTVTRTAFDAGGNVITTPGAAQSLNQTVITQQEHAVFGTGEDFGQFNDSLSAVAAQNGGTGPLKGAHSDSITDTAAYALTRTLVVTGSIGHEEIVYGSFNPYKINDMTWSGGLRWTPNPDSDIAVGYGHQQGGSSLYLDATYAASANTRIYARYSQGVGTAAENLQNAVATSTVGPTGITVDRTTGTPVALNNNFFATQPGLYRTKRGSLSGVVLWPRDMFNLTVQRDETTQVAGSVAGSPATSNTFSTSGTVGSVAWSHDLSESLHSNALVQYGLRTTPGISNKSQGSILLNVGLVYAVSDTLSLSAQYTHTTEPLGFGASNVPREIAVVAVHKTF